jgi:hypothetical protein
MSRLSTLLSTYYSVAKPLIEGMLSPSILSSTYCSVAKPLTEGISGLFVKSL